jgi:class 3 adenylate cyclase
MPDELERPSGQPLVRKLATILSADVAEFSRLMGEDEEQTLRTFRGHKQIFESLVTGHRGRIFNTAGDAILAEFASAVEAVRCATDIQAALRTRNDQLPPNRQVRFRIGINLGDVMLHGEDLLGDGVNVAARLQTAAEPGGICISGSVHDQISNKLSLSFLSLGEMSFKNIQVPVRTFSITHAQGLGDLPSPKPRRAGNRSAKWIAAGLLLLAVLASGSYWAYTARQRSKAQPSLVIATAVQPEVTPREAPPASEPEAKKPEAEKKEEALSPSNRTAPAATPRPSRKEAATGVHDGAPVPVPPATPASPPATPSTSAEGLYDQGVSLFKGKQFSQAAELYRKACDGGERKGCNNLGLMYYNGEGVAKDPNRAADLYRRACEAGGVGGCLNLASMYLQGDGLPRDPNRAANFYQRACDAGAPPGCTRLGLMYSNGEGVAKDPNRAADLFQHACDGGGSGGCLNLALMYKHGRGVPKDLSRAADLFKRACDAGLDKGCENLDRLKK